MFRVDLNADLGESFGAYKIGCDAEVLEQVTSANVACGWHAGDPVVLVPADTDLEDGVYAGTAVTEDLHPISLLLQ